MVEAVLKPNRSKSSSRAFDRQACWRPVKAFVHMESGLVKRRLSLAIRETITVALRKRRPSWAFVALAIMCLSFLSVSTSGIVAGQARFGAHDGQEFAPSSIGADCDANSFEKGEAPAPKHHSHQHCLVCAASGCGCAVERAYFAARLIPFADLILASKQSWTLVERLIPVTPPRLRVSPSRAPPSLA